MNLAHSIEEALDRFELISGAGAEADNQACVMTALAWVAGEAWTDAPTCAHRSLRAAAIAANDADDATPEQRAELVRAGETGIIDTWWVPDIVIVHAWKDAPEEASFFDRVLRAVRFVAEWKETRAYLRGAYLGGAYLGDANLRGAYLGGAYLGDANLGGANLRGAYLGGANLRGANLDDANLRDAYLGGANLRGAYLRGANLTAARYSQLTLWPEGFDPKAAGAILV